MEEARRVLNDLCIRYGLNDEKIIAYSQHVDTLVIKEQMKRFKEIKKKTT